MATLTTLLPLVQAHVEGCDVLTIQTWLRWALREFCKESRFLRQSVPFTVAAGQMVYPMGPVLAETRVIEVDAVSVEGRPLDPTGPKEVRPSSQSSAGVIFDDETGAVVQQPGEVTHYWFEPPADLVLWPQPTRNAPAAASLILDVLPSTGMIPDEIERKYADAISYGALHRLLLMPRKAWSDPQLAGYYEGMFRRQIEEAKSEASRQHRRRHYRVKGHY